ncbi:N-acetylglucosaminyl-diphospho-decaprenol L-rhamnosyltransferase [Polystyrenella longa]|uniref:N-acetylglucosaminyl-diphospho-decaprenol L-rhamnosyltransferase n=1 Tax=Polystyrenella longa TaxID=2528007 RepID=A0A518CRR2_9PLAN|nr:glycosyltransferase [Polystyrenella longa]QDU81919.1 N-acetylglucosaminyl-diphospho-decaprenol L-rhamnosyltransferase [Polystyrenella longa]
MSPPVLDIGVIYTDDDEHMQNLLFSLRASLPAFPIRLLLIENASRQGVERYRELIEPTEVLVNKERRTYAENLNLILAASNAEFVLLLNTDIQFDNQNRCLDRMITFMRQQTDCGVAGCRVYLPGGEYGYPARRLQTPLTFLTRRMGMDCFFPGEKDRYLYTDQNRHGSFACEWLSGCFMLIRREAYIEVGGFDEQFQKYYEDVDYAVRMHRQNWKVMFHGEALCYHNEQRASRNLLSRDAWLHARSWIRWHRKWGWNPSHLLQAESTD